jgi:hypothetical protein
MCFLMAIWEEPERSLSSVMALMIPALYDMVGLLMSANGGEKVNVSQMLGFKR